LADCIAAKCQAYHFCPERNFCGKVKAIVSDYDQEFHERMGTELEQFLISDA
jgi:hypothetical protein